jgi:predicted nucleic acid-binding protein
LEHQFQFLISVPLFLEYEAVLTRPRQLQESGLSRDDVDLLLADLASVGSPVRLAYRWRPVLTDADDDMVLETVVNGGADAIVTFNVRHFRNAQSWFGCEILLPREALHGIRNH